MSELGCGSGGVGVGVGFGTGIDVVLGDCVVFGIGEAVDSYCRIGSDWLPSTGVD